MQKLAPIFFLIFFFVHGLTHAYAQDAEKYAHAEIISGDKGDAALVITMAEGWYSYWRMAGDNGLPPKFDWSQSKNMADVKIDWPVPSRFTFMDMHSFGYMDRMVLPLTIEKLDDAKDVTLSLNADLVVCKDICIPATIAVTQNLSSARQDADVIVAAKSKLPMLENTESIGMNTAVLGRNALVVTAYSKNGFASGAEMILETDPYILVTPPEILLDEDDETRAVLKITAPEGMDLSQKLFGKNANILLIQGDNAVQREFSF